MSDTKNLQSPDWECLAPARIWKVAFELDRWTTAECAHLMACPRCQAHLKNTLSSIRKRAAVLEAAPGSGSKD